MMRYYELMIGDYVLVNGEIRRVEALTKKKIGYHTNDGESTMHYAYLRDVDPIIVDSIDRRNADSLVVNGCILIDFDFSILRLVPEQGHSVMYDLFGNRLSLNCLYVHELQRKIKVFLPTRSHSNRKKDTNIW